MSSRKNTKHCTDDLPCRQCAYVSNPRSPSVKGEPTLATCPFEEFAILYQRNCVNGHYKQNETKVTKSKESI